MEEGLRRKRRLSLLTRLITVVEWEFQEQENASPGANASRLRISRGYVNTHIPPRSVQTIVVCRNVGPLGILRMGWWRGGETGPGLQ
jgi:hypothetical protein